jgi:hypothetical protein
MLAFHKVDDLGQEGKSYIEGLGCHHVAIPCQAHLPLLKVVDCSLREGDPIVPAGSAADVPIQVVKEEMGGENCTH